MSRHGNTELGWLGTTLLLVSLATAQPAQSNSLAQCGLDDVEYVPIELGRLGTDGRGRAKAINDRGTIAGGVSLSDEVGRAFVWDCENGIASIGSLDADTVSDGLDINDRSEIVGQSVNFSLDLSRAFIWDRARGMRAISQSSSLAYDINNWGDVILFDSAGTTLWNARTGPRLVQDVLGFEFTGDVYQNDLRQIGGLRIHEDFSLRFFIWDRRSGVRDLAVAPQAFTVEINGLNERGDIVGILRGVLNQSATIPYIAQRNGEVDLLMAIEPLVQATAASINNRRQVVGNLRSPNRSGSYLWDPHNGARMLRDLLAPASAGIEPNADDINNWGWISGSVTDPTTRIRYPALFVPVPKDSDRHSTLSQLTGRKLCHALHAIKVEAVITCLTQGK